jgi:hypothetical protein
MRKFVVTYTRQFDVVIDAPDADSIVKDFAVKFPSTKVLSVVEHGHDGAPCAACAAEKDDPKKPPRQPKPDPSGGSPQSPALQHKVLDQVTEAVAA